MTGFRFAAGAVIVFSLPSVRIVFGAHPASYPMGIGALSPGVKRPGREPDYSPPSSAEVKNLRTYTSTPIRLHGVLLN
jgi:hypothetical protein